MVLLSNRREGLSGHATEEGAGFLAGGRQSSRANPGLGLPFGSRARAAFRRLHHRERLYEGLVALRSRLALCSRCDAHGSTGRRSDR